MIKELNLAKENAEQEYETIDAADLKEDDVVVEHIHEDAKMEEKENEDGSITDITPDAGVTVTVQLQGLEVQVLQVENRHMRLARVKVLPQQQE